jgi:hypothetical protein
MEELDERKDRIDRGIGRIGELNEKENPMKGDGRVRRNTSRSQIR